MFIEINLLNSIIITFTGPEDQLRPGEIAGIVLGCISAAVTILLAITAIVTAIVRLIRWWWIKKKGQKMCRGID